MLATGLSLRLSLPALLTPPSLAFLLAHGVRVSPWCLRLSPWPLSPLDGAVLVRVVGWAWVRVSLAFAVAWSTWPPTALETAVARALSPALSRRPSSLDTGRWAT